MKKKSEAVKNEVLFWYVKVPRELKMRMEHVQQISGKWKSKIVREMCEKFLGESSTDK